MGGATPGVQARPPDGMNPGLDLQAKTWVGEGPEGPAQVSYPVHGPYPHVTWLWTQETSMGGLLTPRPHCSAPQDPCKEVGADWSEVNPGKLKRPTILGTTGGKAEVSLFWDPRSAHAYRASPLNGGEGVLCAQRGSPGT